MTTLTAIRRMCASPEPPGVAEPDVRLPGLQTQSSRPAKTGAYGIEDPNAPPAGGVGRDWSYDPRPDGNGPREPRARARTYRGADRVNAQEHDRMRRQFEYPDAEQVERLRRFPAGTPSPRRA